MTLSKNPEVLKLIRWLSITAMLCFLITFMFNWIGIQVLERSMKQHHAALIGAVVEVYPNAEAELIQQLQKPDENAVSKGRALLTKYGLQEEHLLNVEVLRSLKLTQGFLLFILTLTAILMVAGVVFLFLRQHYQQLRKVSGYARQIAEGHYNLDLRDNSEGEISQLKNDIYKMTTMLREQKETLQRDKMHLADQLADISHQLKTPMTSLFVMHDLLEDHPAEEVRTEFLQRIRSQLNRMEWLISSLLKLSKLDAGTIAMKRDLFLVSDLINRAREPLAIPLDIKMQQINIEGNLNVYITGDERWSIEALINVLKNAVEHSPERSHISIRVEDNPIYIRLTVTDSGEGIDAEDVRYIFNRFYRGKNAGDDSVGIGLAMAHTIMEKQGGTIAVKSIKGKGTSFYLTFFKVTKESPGLSP